jgi:hypothetical protein
MGSRGENGGGGGGGFLKLCIVGSVGKATTERRNGGRGRGVDRGESTQQFYLLAGKRENKAESNFKKGQKVGDSVGQLQKQLAASEAETKRLRDLVDGEAKPKKQKLSKKSAAMAGAGGASPNPDADPEAETKAAAEALNHRERKRLQRAAYKSAKRGELKKGKAAVRKAEKKAKAEAKPAAVEGAENPRVVEEETRVDVSNWKPYDLDPQIEEALSKLGFGTPTPIQQECLPAAIRDMRDVIGAAQTVGNRHFPCRAGGVLRASQDLLTTSALRATTATLLLSGQIWSHPPGKFLVNNM